PSTPVPFRRLAPILIAAVVACLAFDAWDAAWALAAPVSFQGASTDGSRVALDTNDQLLSADTDSKEDLYVRSGGVLSLVSTGPAGGNGAFDAGFDEIS